MPLSGPYSFSIDLDDAADGRLEELEVRFCNPVYQNDKLDKKSLVFVRKDAADDKDKRAARLTSG